MVSSLISRLNDRRDAAADLGEDAGFTLIELMVVLLILAILLAIAIPTFLGVTGGANDRATQSNLNTAITSLKTQATQSGQSYGAGTAYILASTMKTNEPSLNWLESSTAAQNGTASAVAAPATATSPSNTVSFFVSPDGNGVVVTGWTKSTNSCFYIVDNLANLTGTLAAPWNTTAASTAASATSYPTAAGTYYSKGAVNVTTTPNGCDPAVAPVGATNGAANWGPKFP